jgi:HAD superfamily hydrolase (TIGR01450 family)
VAVDGLEGWHDGAVGWVLDLDGVMWLGEYPIVGSAEAVVTLRDAGEDYVFVTNNSSVTIAAVEERLEAMGAPAVGRVLTSAQAAAGRIAPGERVFLLAGDGAREAVAAGGAVIVDDPANGVDVVVVGLTRALTYDLLSDACLAVRSGARLLATNDDSTYPTPKGQLPGGGALLAAVVTATGATAEVAGKPHQAMVDLVRARLGPDGIVVGDRDDTDGALARALGYRFGLVLTGVSSVEDAATVPGPDVVAPDLAGVVAAVRL